MRPDSNITCCRIDLRTHGNDLAVKGLSRRRIGAHTYCHAIPKLGNLALWDARSENEYKGVSRFSQFPGHIPGAVNLDWLEVMDRQSNLRVKSAEELQQLLDRLGITADKTVVTYCQTHHRSSLTWFVLKYLGYPEARGYPGSWSDWGNREDTPKAC